MKRSLSSSGKFIGVVACLVAGGMAAGIFSVPAGANDQIPGAPQSRPIVIRGGTIHVVDGPAIDNGVIVFDRGVITAVGEQVKAPENAVQIDAGEKQIYPGLIESISDIGLREIAAVSATDDRTERGDQNPNVRSWVAVNPDSELIPVARAGGVLVAMTAPRGRWLRGQTAVLQLDGWTVKEMTLLAPAGLYVDWNAMEPNEDDEKKRVQRREESLQDLDTLLDDVRRYGQARAQRPEQTAVDLRLESLLPVVDGELPLIVEADRQSAIESAVAYARGRQLKLVIQGGYDAAGCAELLKQ
ncbi:MAG: imidazolonepropionase, partial [Pirellulales bacterium]|nr:imidazolonepropionase [Pirellulales bacterium]